MATIITWLSNLKLSLTQWLLATAAAIIGVLVIAFRLQGSKLHRTQVDLLSVQLQRERQDQEGKVEAARKAFQDALKTYREGK